VFDEASLWSARFGLFLLNRLPLRPNLDILDLACGTGFPLFELAHMYGATCRVTGVDSWKDSVERARAKLNIYQLPNVRVLEADAAHLPFEDDAFDLIVSNLGVNNFADPYAVFAECFRVAKPGAHIVLTTNTVGHMKEFYEVFRQTLQELQKPGYLERLQVNEEHRGTKESICSMLQACGFPIAKIEEESFRLRYLDGNALFNHSLTQLGFLDGWRQVVDAEDEERVFTRLENKLNQIAAAQGELRMTVPMLYLEGEKSDNR
jgi:ubiquinone/menaquinone biosynthesis C-methylase UbiE